jgi:hypothetical protein
MPEIFKKVLLVKRFQRIDKGYFCPIAAFTLKHSALPSCLKTELLHRNIIA